MFGDSLASKSAALFGRAGSRFGGAAGDRAAKAELPLFDGIMDEFLSAALVDCDYDITLTPGGGATAAMEAEAKANAAVVKATVQAVDMMELDDEIEEIRISTRDQVQFLRPLDPKGSMYLFVALDQAKGKFFDVARMRVKMVELAFGI